MLHDIVELVSATDSVSESFAIQLSDGASSWGVPPASISTKFSDRNRLILALGVSGDGGSGVWKVHLLGPTTRGVWCTPDMGVGCDCSGIRDGCGVYLMWLRGSGVPTLRHLRTMAGVHISTSHSGDSMIPGLGIPTCRCGVACGVLGVRQGVGGWSSSGGGAMRQRMLSSHTPPCHRRMVITTLFWVFLAALQRKPVLYHTRWLLTVLGLRSSGH